MFYEPTEAADVEKVLGDYGKGIQQSVGIFGDLFYRPPFIFSIQQGSGKHNGALLMAVVGAKLSEGLNFTNDLARAVVMVGLPYPNASSPELKERLRYVSNRSKERGEKEDGGNELYENLCMNAVNQSIGTWFSLEYVVTHSSHHKAVQLGTGETGRAWSWSILGIRHPVFNANYPAGFRLV